MFHRKSIAELQREARAGRGAGGTVAPVTTVTIATEGGAAGA